MSLEWIPLSLHSTVLATEIPFLLWWGAVQKFWCNVGMSVCGFGVGGYFKLPNKLSALGNLFPCDLAGKKFQVIVVGAGGQRYTTS
jgi:hypothetical protein